MKQVIFQLFLFFLFAKPPLFSQSIGLDESFASNGLYSFGESGTSEYFTDVAVQNDGKPVAVGYTDYDPDESNHSRLIVTRFNINGTPDPTFGANGKVYVDNSQATDEAVAIKIQSDGKIVICGKSDVPWSPLPSFTLTSGTVYRLNVNGTLDNSFGTNGRAYIDGEVCRFFNLVIQPNGYIVVSGYGLVDSKFSYIVARFNTNGQLDSSFGNGAGFVKFRSSTYSTEEDNGGGYGLALQPDGKILTCGYDEKETGTAARLNTNGTLDNTFGYNGFQYWDFTRDVYLYSIGVQSDGKIVLAGTYDYSSSANKAIIIRVHPNGNFDTSFNNGSTLNWYGNNSALAYDMEIQSDGKYVLGGGLTLIRAATNSQLDTYFDGDGVFTIPITQTYIQNIKLSGNKIYAVGYQYNSGDYNGFIAKVNNNFNTTNASEPVVLPVSIHPNPAFDLVNIVLEDGDTPQELLAEVRNSNGDLMKSEVYSNMDQITLPVNSWPNGIYFLHIATDKGCNTVPFMVQH